MKQAMVCLGPSTHESNDVADVVLFFAYKDNPPTLNYVTDLIFKCFEEIAADGSDYSPNTVWGVAEKLFESQWHEMGYEWDPIEGHGFRYGPFKAPITAYYCIDDILGEAEFWGATDEPYDRSIASEVRELIIFDDGVAVDPVEEIMVEDPHESDCGIGGCIDLHCGAMTEDSNWIQKIADTEDKCVSCMGECECSCGPLPASLWWEKTYPYDEDAITLWWEKTYPYDEDAITLWWEKTYGKL